MRTIPILVLLIVLGCPLAYAEDLYIAQSSAGSANGSSCANAFAYTFFNTSGNWGAGAGKISAGDTVHLCGTITSQLTAQGSGSAGNTITILFESGASLSQSACGSTGCLNIAAKSYLTIDGGANGIIEATNQGTGLGSSSSYGIYGRSGISHVEIKNILIRNMYIHNGMSDNNGGGTYCIWMDGTNNLIHNNVLHDCESGVTVEANSNNNQFYNNTIYNCNWGIFESGAASANSIHDEKLYNNEVYDFANWDTTADTFHHDGLFVSGNSASTDVQNVQIYNNYLHGTSSSCSPSCMTAYIFTNTATAIYTYNNLIVANNGEFVNNAWIFHWANSNDIIANNTVIGGTASGSGGCIYGLSLTNATIYNNIASNCGVLMWMDSTTFSALDNNLYQASSLSSKWRIGSNFYSTLASWQSASGGDSNGVAQTGSLNLNASYYPLVTSSAVGAGSNLTSLGVTALDTDKASVARPPSSAWDIGAYQYVPPPVGSSTAGPHTRKGPVTSK